MRCKRASRGPVGHRRRLDRRSGTDDLVTVPQLRVLMMVRIRGLLTLRAVAAALEGNPSNASHTCDRPIKAGLLDRRDSPTNRRN